MGLLASIDRSIRNATYNDRDGWFRDWLVGDDGERTDSGVRVNERNSMQISTVWKCVDWRARMFGMLPKKLFERVIVEGAPGQAEATTHPLYDIIHSAPNPLMSSFAYFALMSADMHLWGNSYSYVERAAGSMRIASLWRIPPDCVRVHVDTETSDVDQLITYFVRGANGIEKPYYQDEILHVRGLGGDGVCGYSSIRLHIQALGWNKAAVRYGAQFFKNASRPSGMLISDTAIKDKAIKDGIVDSLSKSGSSAGKLMLIEGGFKYQSITMPQDEAQFIETIQYQEDDICGIMGVKPHEVGIMRHSTNNNIEQETISSVSRVLAPLAVSIEQWLNLQLLSSRPSSGRGGATERSRYFIECELKGLLRGDTAAQTAHIKEMIDRGVMTQNEGCDALGRARFKGGDRHYINSAYIPLDKIDEFLTQRNTTAGSTSTSANQPGPDPKPDTKALKAQVLMPIFRDAVGRVIARKKDREKEAAKIFRNLVIGAGESPSEEFLNRYVDAIGQRAAAWEESTADAIARDEVERAIQSFSGRS